VKRSTQKFDLGSQVQRKKFSATVSGGGYGYVYVMSYPGSTKLKIGHSDDPENRAKDIGGTKAPETPVLEASFWCSERREVVERKAHKLAKHLRHNGEWFDLSVEQALGFIRTAAASVKVEVQLIFDRSETDKKAAAAAESMRLAEAAEQEKHNQALKMVEREAEADRQAALRKTVVEQQMRDFVPEPEAVRLERVRIWKLNEAVRLQERYEKALRLPDPVIQRAGTGVVLEVSVKVIDKGQ